MYRGFTGMNICVPCACLVPPETRKVLDPMGLLHMAVNNYAGVGN